MILEAIVHSVLILGVFFVVPFILWSILSENRDAFFFFDKWGDDTHEFIVAAFNVGIAAEEAAAALRALSWDFSGGYLEDALRRLIDRRSIDAPPLLLVNPGEKQAFMNSRFSCQMWSHDPDGRPLTYSASGLPAGLSINSFTGEIHGVPDRLGTWFVQVYVTASNYDGLTKSFATARFKIVTRSKFPFSYREHHTLYDFEQTWPPARSSGKPEIDFELGMIPWHLSIQDNGVFLPADMVHSADPKNTTVAEIRIAISENDQRGPMTFYFTGTADPEDEPVHIQYLNELGNFETLRHP